MANPVSKRIAQLVFFTLLTYGTLFVAAGTLNWPAAWLLLAMSLAGMAGTAVVIFRTSPDLIAERARGLKGTQRWDRLLGGILVLIGPLAMWVVAGLDRRFGWSGAADIRAQAAGVALAAAGFALVVWAMGTNRFFSAAVRIQKERGHRVVSSGPYAFVRHPGYVGMIAYNLATPLILGTSWAFLPAGAIVLATVARTALEDRMLRRELEGYADYAARVRWRLLPGVW